MSRSTKKPIIKDKPRNHKRTSEYWRKVRRSTGNKLRTHLVGIDSEDLQDIDEPFLPQPREIVNDYDYCDWIWHLDDEDSIKKHSRK